MRDVVILGAVLGLLGCGGGSRAASTTTEAAPIVAAPGGDPHRKLTADECGSFYDYMKSKGWLAEPDAQRDKVIASCLEMGATQAFHECIFGSTSREDADRCQ